MTNLDAVALRIPYYHLPFHVLLRHNRLQPLHLWVVYTTILKDILRR